MKPKCPNPKCVLPSFLAPQIKPIVRNGYTFRKSDSRHIARFYCRLCGSYFSSATFDPRFNQKNRRINAPLFKLLCSGVSQRRAARILGVNPKTVVRRFRFLAAEERSKCERSLEVFKKSPSHHIQFDELETSEHTKCKPISVMLAVDQKTRKILSFQASSMPAKGTLARISVRKYGKRQDDRAIGAMRLMHEIKPYVHVGTQFTSDDNPLYPRYLKRHHPQAVHVQVKGGRGAITGQGELKKLKYDPLFSLNHTCAMLRANMNRLFRRTWCTTKNIQGLIDHLSIYVAYHNRVLTGVSDGLGGS